MTDNDPPAARASPPPSIAPRATTTSFDLPSIPSTASASGPVPSGHPFRRSVTSDDASQPLRRRPVSMQSFPSSDAGEPPLEPLRRRSTTLSDFSLSEARRSFSHGTQNILNPSAAKHADETREASSVMSSLPLAFALLPALVGVFFEGGSAFITDFMLLALVFIFLRYTITQPWQWYHEAQEVRIKQEVGLEQVYEGESETEMPSKMSSSVMTLDEVPEETSQDGQDNDDGHETHTDTEHHEEHQMRPSADRLNRTRVQEAAVNELYYHEVLALLSCFISPVVGAYLLHAIRAQLTQRSEGLMTNFNISVFLLAAELRPMSHALKLIQARTLHLQRIVQSTPIARSTTVQLEEMRSRMAQLELRASATEEATAAALARATHLAQQPSRRPGADGGKDDAALVREVCNAIQPELDALNRAVRRYEKKSTVLALQTESRLGGLDLRLNDAIALTAAVAKHSQLSASRWGVGAWASWLAEWVVTIVLAPYHVLMFCLMWPFRFIAGLCFQRGRASRSDGHGRASAESRAGRYAGFRGMRAHGGSGSDKDRVRGDRVPSRLSRR